VGREVVRSVLLRESSVRMIVGGIQVVGLEMYLPFHILSLNVILSGVG
jgi:hypothetical protein